MMNRQIWIIYAAGGLALGILAATVLIGGSRGGSVPAGDEKDSTMSPIVDEAPVVTEFKSVGKSTKILLEGEGVYYTSRDRPVQFMASHVERVDDERLRVTEPHWRIHRDKGQIIEIRADSGEVIAPNDDPRRGDLEGNVEIRLYRGHDSVSSTGDSEFHIELDNAHFDYDLGQIRSDRDVKVRHGRVQFDGRGLSLSYNELYRRIEKLVINQGKQLRFQIDPGRLRRSSKTTSNNGAITPEVAPATAKSRVAETYRVELERDVTVQGHQIKAAGSRLEAFFSLGESSGSHSGNGDGGLIADSSEYGADHPGANELVMTWSGKLTMVPVDELPIALTGTGDAWVVMDGAPLRVNVAGDDINAFELSYHLGTKRLGLSGSPGGPVQLDSKLHGQLTAPRILLDRLAGWVQLIGAGRFASPGHRPPIRNGDDPDARSTQAAWLTRMTTTWNDRGELLFYDQANASDGAAAQMSAIRQAVFHGGVKVSGPSLDLSAQELSIELLKPVNGVQNVDQITAKQKVVAKAHQADGQSLAIRSDQLALRPPRMHDGLTQPGQLLAQGNVTADGQQMEVKTEYLEITLSAPQVAAKPHHLKVKVPRLSPVAGAEDRSEAARDLSASMPGRSDEAKGPAGQIWNRLIARQGARIELIHGGDLVIVTAEQVIVDQVSGQIEVIGADAQPAKIVRGDTTLIGRHIFLDGQNYEQMRVNGSGTGVVARENKIRAGSVLAMSWAQGMELNHSSGKGRIFGEIVVENRSRLHTTTLTAQEMDFQLSPQTDRGIGKSIIEKLVARKDVEFRAVNWRREIGGEFATKLLIQSSEMVFENTATLEQIRFVGEGGWIFQDDRPRPQGGKPNTQITVSGRGDTVFTWSDQMVLDVKRNDMRIYGDVWMQHNPKNGGKPIEMFCDRFVADMTETGGLSRWGSRIDGQLETIVADRGVQVKREDVEITSGTMKHTQRDGYLTFTSSPGSQTLVAIGDQVTRHTKPLRWNTKTGQIEVGPVGAIRRSVR